MNILQRWIYAIVMCRVCKHLLADDIAMKIYDLTEYYDDEKVNANTSPYNYEIKPLVNSFDILNIKFQNQKSILLDFTEYFIVYKIIINFSILGKLDVNVSGIMKTSDDKFEYNDCTWAMNDISYITGYYDITIQRETTRLQSKPSPMAVGTGVKLVMNSRQSTMISEITVRFHGIT